MKTMLESILAAPPACADPQAATDEFKKLIKSSVRAGSCVSNPEGHCAGGVGAGCYGCGGCGGGASGGCGAGCNAGDGGGNGDGAGSL